MTLIFCLKHTLTLEDDVDVWLAKLVQGGYIPSAFHLTTHILQLYCQFLCVLKFLIASLKVCVLKVSLLQLMWYNSRDSVIMTLTVGKTICESPLTLYILPHERLAAEARVHIVYSISTQ